MFPDSSYLFIKMEVLRVRHKFVSTLTLTHELGTKERAGLGLDIQAPGRVAGPTWEVKEGHWYSHPLSTHGLSTGKETALHL